VATAKRPLTPAQDLAAARGRAKVARTPASKRVVEAKERTYSGQAAREASAQMRRGVHPVAIGTPGAAAKKGSGAASKATPKKAAPKRRRPALNYRR
jgi:hypothetical protein